ncbi:MAG: hypothetical protein EOM91_19735 [Sphingobacteriia bacterium]|nr:hypothetical protein [Sphingobacteriia bacterium]NCC41412.1 hypothetical protein [Gammaproteobacteria bacterium]
MNVTSQAFLAQLCRSPAANEAAVADNCRFDERASADRWQRFEDLLCGLIADPSVIALPDWAEANRLNLERYCEVPTSTVPNAWLDINRGAWLTPSGNQDLIRFEVLTRPLAASRLTADGLEQLLARADQGDSDALQAAAQFFEAWNLRRDARPTFAAFLDEVKAEVEADDWPHALRDRLGLGFYGRPGGNPLPVALMRYSLGEVLAAKAGRFLHTACALPTVLDGGMHEFFFPVPQEHTFGATLHLDPEQADTLTAEILHCRIDYQREHLWKLGVIDRPHGLRDAHLRQPRGSGAGRRTASISPAGWMVRPSQAPRTRQRAPPVQGPGARASGPIEPGDTREMLAWENSGFSLDAAVRVNAHDRAGLKRLLRYCAQPLYVRFVEHCRRLLPRTPCPLLFRAHSPSRRLGCPKGGW